jgi:SurA-like protein
MVAWLQFALALLLAVLGSAVGAGEIIDRIVATVNGVPVLQSDVDEAVRCEAMLNGRLLEDITAAEQQSALERLIDQELLRQQMGTSFREPTAAALADRLRQLREQLPAARGDEQWRATLARYGLTEADLNERVAAQLRISAFVESHLQPDVHVDAASISAYYRESLLPELRRRGATTEPTLAEVTGQIEQILQQQRINDMLSSWLQTLRQQSQVRIQTGSVSVREPGSHAMAGTNSK